MKGRGAATGGGVAGSNGPLFFCAMAGVAASAATAMAAARLVVVQRDAIQRFPIVSTNVQDSTPGGKRILWPAY